MKKVLQRYYTTQKSDIGWMSNFEFVQDTTTGEISIMVQLMCIDGVERVREYSIEDFDMTWGVNLFEIDLTLFLSLAVAGLLPAKYL